MLCNYNVGSTLSILQDILSYFCQRYRVIQELSAQNLLLCWQKLSYCHLKEHPRPSLDAKDTGGKVHESRTSGRTGCAYTAETRHVTLGISSRSEGTSIRKSPWFIMLLYSSLGRRKVLRSTGSRPACICTSLLNQRLQRFQFWLQ